MNKKLVIANFKSNKTVAESLDWLNTVGEGFKGNDLFEVLVCPSFVALESMRKLRDEKEYSVKITAQDVSPFDLGAYTGAVGAKQLVGLAEYVLIGHSERRKYFGETNVTVAQKVEQCNYYSLIPVVLVRDVEDTVPEDVKYFGWEPVSAIGTGNTIPAEEAAVEIAKFTEKRSGLLGMYGGSVNVSSVASFMTHTDICGVVIGSASLDARNFLEIVHAIH